MLLAFFLIVLAVLLVWDRARLCAALRLAREGCRLLDGSLSAARTEQERLETECQRLRHEAVVGQRHAEATAREARENWQRGEQVIAERDRLAARTRDLAGKLARVEGDLQEVLRESAALARQRSELAGTLATSEAALGRATDDLERACRMRDEALDKLDQIHAILGTTR